MNQTTISLLCFILPCLSTTVGSLLVFFFNKPSNTISKITLGLSGGIMLSASIWSLLLPSMEYSAQQLPHLSFLPVSLGFIIGTLFMFFLDFLCSKPHKQKKIAKEDNKNVRIFKYFTAITIHNIPEGLCVGFALGSAIATQSPLTGALTFALGITFQNLPEGLATAFPIYQTGKNKKKAFLLAFLSGVVEPVFAIIGYLLASSVTILMPWLLSFSAGTMFYVIFQELIPDLYSDSKKTLSTWFLIIGFTFMMILDTCL